MIPAFPPFVSPTEFPFDLSFVPVAVLTPLCCQTAWIIYNVFYYGAILMTHVDNVSRATSGHVTLTTLALLTVAWLVADLTVMETYTRHLVGVYLLFAGFLTASLVGCSSSSSSAAKKSGVVDGAVTGAVDNNDDVGKSGVGGVAAVNKVIIGLLTIIIVGFVCVKIGCCVDKMRKGRKYSLTHEKITFA